MTLGSAEVSPPLPKVATTRSSPAGNLYCTWHLHCRPELILLPGDRLSLFIALAEVSSLLRMPREKVG